MFRKIGKNKKGFTLIELIVVVGILGVLAAVLIPRVMGFTSTAKNNTDSANRRLLHNVAAIVIAQGEDITTDDEDGYIDSENYVADTDMDKYLESWPVKQNGGAFKVKVTDGVVSVE